MPEFETSLSPISPGFISFYRDIVTNIASWVWQASAGLSYRRLPSDPFGILGERPCPCTTVWCIGRESEAPSSPGDRVRSGPTLLPRASRVHWSIAVRPRVSTGFLPSRVRASAPTIFDKSQKKKLKKKFSFLASLFGFAGVSQSPGPAYEGTAPVSVYKLRFY